MKTLTYSDPLFRGLTLLDAEESVHERHLPIRVRAFNRNRGQVELVQLANNRVFHKPIFQNDRCDEEVIDGHDYIMFEAFDTKLGYDEQGCLYGYIEHAPNCTACIAMVRAELTQWLKGAMGLEPSHFNGSRLGTILGFSGDNPSVRVDDLVSFADALNDSAEVGDQVKALAKACRSAIDTRAGMIANKQQQMAVKAVIKESRGSEVESEQAFGRLVQEALRDAEALRRRLSSKRRPEAEQHQAIINEFDNQWLPAYEFVGPSSRKRA